MAESSASRSTCTTGRAALAVCAVFSLVTCLLVAPAVAPDVHRAYAAPKALSVTFNDSTGVATWKAEAGVTQYWFECEENPIVNNDETGFCVSCAVDPDASGNCSFDAKAYIEEMVSSGQIHSRTKWNLRAWADDNSAEWTHVYAYTPVAKPYSELSANIDPSTGKLSWDAFAGADAYWIGVDNQSAPLSATSVNLPELIDSFYTNFGLAKKNSYNIEVVAYSGVMMLAKWSGTYSYTPKTAVDPTSATLPTLPVTFSKSTGKATWKAYSGASTYWYAVDDGRMPLTGRTADFKALIDWLYTNGDVAKKSSYEISVIAVSGTSAPLASWSTTYTYTPKKADSALTLSPSLANLPVTFSKKTGKATWKAYSGAKSYWYGIDGGFLPLEGRSADFKALIDKRYTDGALTKKKSYTISVMAYGGDSAQLAQWSTTFAYTPKKVSVTTDASSTAAKVPKLPVKFKKTTGKATWKAYKKAKVYFVGVDGIYSASAKSVNFRAIIDGLYLKGSIKKKSKYKIEVIACSAGSAKVLAKWSTTYKYKPAPKLSRATCASIPVRYATGKAQKPNPVLYMGNTLLKKGKHYMLSYKSNKKVGKATVVIKGKGRVKGTLKKTFKIMPMAPNLKVSFIGAGTATVEWSYWNTDIDGVQVRYAQTDSVASKSAKASTRTFAGTGTTSLSITGQRNDKTTFVWIRSYKKVGSKNYYSYWNPIWFGVL